MALEAIRNLHDRKSSGKYISSYTNYPKLGTLDNGFPSIHHETFGNTPPDYKLSLIHDFGGEDGYKSWESFKSYIDYVRQVPDLLDYYLPRVEGRETDFADPALSFFPFELVNRYLHQANHEFSPLNTDDLLKIYRELEEPIFSNTLPVSAVVPLTLTSMEIERFQLTEEVTLERIRDDEQLARSADFYEDSNVSMNKWVVNAATHAIVISGLSVSRQHLWSFDTSICRAQVLSVADDFVRALAIGAGTASGYAQIYYRPHGWASRYQAGLPVVQSKEFIRRYPPNFDRDWRSLVSPIQIDDLETSRDVFSNLRSSPDRLKVAARRFGMAMLREEEEDAILDLCIGLESVFGDNSPGETTYKLAMRAAKLLGKRLSISESAVFNAVKKIYSYRSSVAHGRNSHKLRMIDFDTDATYPATVLAEFFLRSGLMITLRDERITPDYIDKNILLISDNDD